MPPRRPRRCLAHGRSLSMSPSPSHTLPADALEPDDAGDDLLLDAAEPHVATARDETLLVPAEAHGQRLDAFLGAQITAYSRSHLKSLIEEGLVSVNGAVLSTPSRKVQQGQTVQVHLRPTAQSLAFTPEAMDLPIVFEDAHMLVLNKPAGLVVHPAAGNWQGTLMNGLLAHHAGAAGLPRAGIVHRLDKDTSGLMVVGKTLEAVTALSRAIAAREVKRQYLALVHGEVEPNFSVSSSIGRDPVTRVRMAVVPSGKPARTDVQRLVCGAVAGVGGQGAERQAPRVFSGVLCTLHTGRTHQIRVHLSSRRHPLVADALYGGAPALGLQRQALHATRLGLAHPITGAPLLFEADLPTDMAAAWGAVAGEQTGV